MSTQITQFPITLKTASDLTVASPNSSDKLFFVQSGTVKISSISDIVASSPQSFASLTSKPTTLSGYGITDYPLNPICVISLLGNGPISSTAGTAVSCNLGTNGAYYKQTDFSGQINIDGSQAASGNTGQLTFVPNASKTYLIKIIGTLYSSTSGNTGVSLSPSGGGIGVVASANMNGIDDCPLVGGRIINGSIGTLTLTSFQPPGSSADASFSYSFFIQITQLN